jgi:sirohydrochlorin ferrochelatase
MIHYLLIDHGSRNINAHEQLKSLSERLSKDNSIQMSFAHLEISQPYFKDVLFSLCKNQHLEIRILPLFIFKGKHLSKDIPEIVEEARQAFPEVKITLESSLGESSVLSKTLGELWNLN